MANRYLRSTDGDDADDGSTWALAKAKIGSASGIGSIDTAGDTVWFSQDHAETTATAFSYVGAGTLTNPVKLLCGNDAAEPPTALATGATVTCTAASGTSALQGSFYAYGIKWQYAATLQLAAGNAACFQHFDNCTFDCTGAGSSGNISVALDNVSARILHTNTSLKFANAGNTFMVGHKYEMKGGSALSGTATPSALFKLPTDRTHTDALIDGFDFSNFASSLVLFSNAGVGSAICVVRDGTMPAGWSGTLTNGTPKVGQRFEMYNCSASGINYALWIEDYSGTIVHETTVVKTGGSSDGTTPLSWKMTTNANALYPSLPLQSPDMMVWIDTTGSLVTITVDIIHDSVTNLKDDEVWIEIIGLATSGSPLGTFVRDSKADYLATAADQTASSATWTETGLTNPNKQKLSASFTPGMKGPVIARVMHAKTSNTIYVDRVPQVS